MGEWISCGLVKANFYQCLLERKNSTGVLLCLRESANVVWHQAIKNLSIIIIINSYHFLVEKTTFIYYYQ